jgi:glutathione S-transferase
MQLIGMLDSPYVRRVAVALIVAKVPFEHRPISIFRHIDAFSNINPLLKAPTLVADDGTVLMDSGVILDYLAAAFPRIAGLTPPQPHARLRALRLTALALTVMEKAVQRHYERMLRPPEKRHDPVDRASRKPTRRGPRRARSRSAAKRLDRRGARGRRHLRGLRLRLRTADPFGRFRDAPISEPRRILRARRGAFCFSRRPGGRRSDRPARDRRLTPGGSPPTPEARRST